MNNQVSKKINPKTRVFVGALPLTVNKKSLKSYFETFGKVTRVQLGLNRKTKERMGFAFVDFKKRETTETVLSQEHYFNGRDIDVKPFECVSSNIKAERDACLSRRVHIKAIPDNICREDLFAAMSEQFGPVERAFIMYNQGTGQTRGFGFVTFTEQKLAEYAVSVGSVLVQGIWLEVSNALPRGREGYQYREMLQKNFVGQVLEEFSHPVVLGNALVHIKEDTTKFGNEHVNSIDERKCLNMQTPFSKPISSKSSKTSQLEVTVSKDRPYSLWSSTRPARQTGKKDFSEKRPTEFQKAIKRISRVLSEKWVDPQEVRFNISSPSKQLGYPKKYGGFSLVLDEQF